MIKNYTNNIYGKYLSMLGLMVKLSSISLKLIGDSALPLLNNLKSTDSTHYMTKQIYQASHQNSEFNHKNKIKIIGKQNFILSKNIKDTWLQKLICPDRIYLPT